MKRRFILYRRNRGGVFYLQNTETRKQESLGTKNRDEALTLLHSTVIPDGGAERLTLRREQFERP